MHLYPYSRDECRRFYYYLIFKQLPYKDFFFFRAGFKVPILFLNLKFYIFSGKFWFRIKITNWHCGFSLKFFTWSKKIAIYKKKKK
uniref:Ribosomal protein S19 n=1 Tax=Euplotes vanleeuwenhoeki TaxID=2794224 RepID=A0A7T1C506_9SPIT|nr:hypothetical protein KQ443_mgp21 [Euplotes vanleeuwenhoeki]QPM99257.1 hypothetical protein MitoLV_29 [Euplotes vanleeuwenhoeki]